MRSFIHSLPKAELHLHLEGALPWDLIQAHTLEPLPAKPIWWNNDFLFDDFDQFTQTMGFCYRHILTSVERYHLVARHVFQNLAAQNARYVEISFSPEHTTTHRLPLTEVIAAIKEAAPASLIVRVFCGLGRTQPHRLTDTLIKEIFKTPNLDGLDLHGHEALQKPAPFAPIFIQAKQNGLLTKAHAGEHAGPQSIRDALDHLQVTRIEHGATAIWDEALMDRLAIEEITLDMCPSSNLKLRVVENIATHPIREFHQRGIRVTVNTDDPTLFGCTLSGELNLLAEKLHFSPCDLAQLQVNAFQVAKIPATTREAILAEIEQLLNHTVK